MHTPRELRMSDYIASIGNAIEDIRLLIEGAVYLYSEETEKLFWLARANDEHMAAQSLSAIGGALFLLQKHARDMQAAYADEVKRQMAEASAP